MLQILIVGGEKSASQSIKKSVERLGYSVLDTLTNYDDAISYVQSHDNIDLILMNTKLDGQIDGIDTIIDIKKIKDIPFLYVSAKSDDLTISRASDTKPLSFWNKPFKFVQIKASLALVKHKIETA